jgi:hypothetical protein
MLIATVVSTSLALAVPAHADNASDFLAIVSAQGVNVGDTAPDVQLTLGAAEHVCQVLHNGFTPQEAGRQVLYALPNLTPTQVTGFVDAAQAKLCAEAYGPLQPAGSY